jgi:hypothetical protein
MVETLSKDAIEQAIRLEGVSHPVVGLMDRFSPQMNAEASDFLRLSPKDPHSYLRGRSTFWLEALKKSEDFTLKPLEMISVGAKLYRVLPSPISTFEGGRLVPYFHRIIGATVAARFIQHLQGAEIERLFCYLLEPVRTSRKFEVDEKTVLSLRMRCDEIERGSQIIGNTIEALFQQKDPEYQRFERLLDWINDPFGNCSQQLVSVMAFIEGEIESI